MTAYAAEDKTAADELSAYPSIELAYPLAVASYDTAIKRFDSIDGRLQTIVAFVAAVSVAIPSIASGKGISFQSVWFYLALLCFVSVSVVGIYARLMGGFRALSPDALFNHWLSKPAVEFKKDLIYFSGQDFEYNTRIIETKWRVAVGISVVFLFQAVFLAAWVLGSAPT